MQSDQVTRHWKVQGRVQGVGFRAFVWREASRHQLSGWARNLHDGSVEIVVSGAEGSVDAFREAVREGPRSARVDRVEEQPATVDTVPQGEFQIRHDR
jgi:acylphosphatase